MKVEGETIGTSSNPWRIGSQLGQGACGAVHSLHHAKTCTSKTCKGGKCNLYAIKVVELPLEKAKPKKKKSEKEIMAGLLSYEIMLYKGILSSLRGKYVPDIPLYNQKDEPYPAYNEVFDKRFAYMVMERMESPISSVKNLLNTKETLGDVFLSMLECVRAIHKRGAIVVDLKADNFMLAQESSKNKSISSRVRLIDFGLLKLCGMGGKFNDDLYPNAKMEGTPCYMSLNVMQGHSVCHRDDLESLCYIFMEVALSFANETLPWSNESSDDKLRQLKEDSCSDKKTGVFTMIKNYFGASLSSILQEFYDYTRSLEYAEKPDYDKLSGMIAPLKLTSNGSTHVKKTAATDKSKSAAKRKQSLSDDEEVEVVEVTASSAKTTRKKAVKAKPVTKRKQQAVADNEESDDESSVEVIATTTRRTTKRNNTSSKINSTKEKKTITLDDDEPLNEDSDEEYYSAHEEEIKSPQQTKSTKSKLKDISNNCNDKKDSRDVKISIINGPNKGTSITIDESPITLGREPDNDENKTRATKIKPKTYALNDPEVSSKHALLSLQTKSKETFLYINDLYSTNGTYVNGKKIKKTTNYKLVHGDTFTIGKYTFLVTI